MLEKNLARLVVVAVALAGLLTLPRPSWACGCGALVTPAGSRADVAQETSIVRYDAGREQIVMRLSVRSQATNAAWLMPTPTRARVTLGESTWFDQLDRLTEPAVERHRHWLPRLHTGGPSYAAAPRRPDDAVGVLGRQRLGPFEVTTLSAGDSRALAAWLTSHGYHLPGRLAEALRPYVAEHWTYAAVKLVPEHGPLAGDLDPLSITFAAGAPVYPIRLSRLARTPQSVHLYVLAPHRVGVPRVGMAATFAGRVTPAQVTSPGLRAVLGRGAFLTELYGQGIPPSVFTDDLRFGYTTDTPYRQVRTVDGGLVEFLGVPAFVWLVVLAAAGVGLATVIPARRAARARRGTAPASP